MATPRKAVLLDILENMHGQRNAASELARLNPNNHDLQIRDETAKALLTPLIKQLSDELDR